MTKDYQKLTEEIAESGGVQMDNRIFSEPIYASWITGTHLRGLIHAHKHPLGKIIFGLIFFIFPAVVFIAMSFTDLLYRINTEYIPGLILIFLFGLLYLFIGIRFSLSGYLELWAKQK